MYEIGSREYEMYNSILIVARYELSLEMMYLDYL